MSSTSGPGGDRDALDATPWKAWLDVLFETSPSAMAVVSVLESRYVRANQAMADLIGTTVEELLSCDPYSLALRVAHPDDLVAEQKLFADFATGLRRFYRIEKRYVRSDGSIRWGLLTFSGIYDAPIDPAAPVGPLRFVIVHVIDITENKAMAETLRRREDELRHAQKIDGIGRLASGIAHDFNNLLTVITGHGEILKALADHGAGVPSPSDLEEGLDAILGAAERASSLTAQLLAHGRREPVAPRAFLLSEAVRDLQRLLGRTIGSHIGVDLSLAAVGAVFADQGQVGQIVMNLILNARDAIPDGGRIGLATHDLVQQIEADPSPGDGATLRAIPGPGAWVALVVSDDGHGMPPEVQERMFEPFFTTRGDRPGTQGTGLGLSTVARIVAELGGHIQVKSAVGEGTTVTIFLPRVANLVASPPASETSARAVAAPNSRRVLVVEDEPSVRSLVANVLLGAHYWVSVARDGGEALRLIEAEGAPFHLIVTDLAMPGLGGLALAKRLRREGREPRMLFISGYSRHAPSEIAAFGQLLPKPFTPAQLLEAVVRSFDEPA